MRARAQPEARYAQVVHHANVNPSLAYVARKTGLGYQETERLLEEALKSGDLVHGDYSGRKLEHLEDERMAALKNKIAELEAKLVREAQRTAAEKLRADQMTEQHRMQSAMNAEARAELAQLREKRQPLSDEWYETTLVCRHKNRDGTHPPQVWFTRSDVIRIVCAAQHELGVDGEVLA